MSSKHSCIALIITISGLLSVPSIAQAKDIESYEDYKGYCSPAAYQYGIANPDCEKFKSIYGERYKQELNSQPTRRNTEIQESTQRESSDNDVKGYIGTSIGLFFPDTDILNTGFGVSLYGGAKFNQYIATDIELDLLGGGTIESDVAYGVFAAFINPRFIYPFSDEEKSASVYFSPGIGISAIGVGNGDVTVTDDTRLTWQTKIGIPVPVSKRLSTFGQLRYASTFQEDAVGFFGTEIGLDFQF
ncbi:MAG: hypothetical protein RLZZ574_1322 [Cyanobacteriota bacterium]|jgi:hypothetical protein